MEMKHRGVHRRGSPERAARVWAEPLLQKPPPVGRKVSVVYYLCRSRHLEHPHFIEVPLSSPLGLYLRDVIDRLNVLRGKGMAAMYSWSCKRSYKNGFVWHDISEDDLILPAHGDEYVLKGSELVDDLPPGRIVDACSSKRQTQKLVLDTTARDSPSSSASTIERPAKLSQQEHISPPLGRSGSSEMSPEFRGSPLCEYQVHSPDRAANAATQTDIDGERRLPPRDTCTRGVSTEEGLSDQNKQRSSEQMVVRMKKSSEISQAEILPSPSSGTSSGGKTETLESLIRADVNKMKSFRILEEEQVLTPTHTKLKPSNVLMQLITCGSITVKDHHSFGFVPTYRPKFLSFPSPTLSGTTTGLGELDWLPDNPRLMGLKLEEKEYFSGSLIETGKHKGEDENFGLQRSNSYNADRTSRLSDSTSAKEESEESVLSKCIPLNLKTASNKPTKTELAKSPMSEKPRKSVKNNFSHAIPVISPNESARKTANHSNTTKSSKKLEPFKEKDKLIKIEERLASGARVIIQLRTPDAT